MAKIIDIKAREILDSRGNPTVETMVILEGEIIGVTSVPSGTSVGKYETVELRDNDPGRMGGMGVLKAVANVNEIIKPKLIGLEAKNQTQIDQLLISLDGTPNKSRLGANAILSVSQGICKAEAAAEKMPLYHYVASLFGLEKDQIHIPVPTLNLINGGKHGAGNLDFQEFHIVPSLDKTYSQSLEMAQEIYHTVKKVLIHHGAIHSVGDEGGFAPNLFTNLDALEILIQAIKESNHIFKSDVFLGLDVAAGFFYKNGKYTIRDRTSPLETDDLLEFYRELISQYPLVSLEDPFFEDDWQGWIKITQTLPQIMIIGDDLLATNKERTQQAIRRQACRAILVKPNQVGTITETIEVIKIAKNAGWKIIVSHRSGETNDDFITDFAVGVGADYVKFGAPARGERIAKYNRLLQIEEEIKING